jgi:hypothetical protein
MNTKLDPRRGRRLLAPWPQDFKFRGEFLDTNGKTY